MKTCVCIGVMAVVAMAVAAPGAAQAEAPPTYGVNAPGSPGLQGEPPTDDLPPGPPPSNLRGQPPDDRVLDTWLEHLRERDPEEYRRLTELREEDPAAFRRALQERRERLRRRDLRPPGEAWGPDEGERPRGEHAPLEVRRRPGQDEAGQTRRRSWPRAPEDPEIKRLERETRALVEEYRRTPEPDREAVRARLQEHVEALFDLRETQRRALIERMARKLEHLQGELDRRAAERDQIIDRRIEELIKVPGPVPDA